MTQREIKFRAWDQDEIVGYRVKYASDGLAYSAYLCGWYEYEIIGNIYENPTLLEG